MVGGQEPIRKEVSLMNDIYDDIHSLSSGLIEAVFPSEDNGDITPISLNCEITRGDITYIINTERNEEGSFDCTINAKIEEGATIIKAIKDHLSSPETVERIINRDVTTAEAVNEAVKAFEAAYEIAEKYVKGK